MMVDQTRGETAETVRETLEIVLNRQIDPVAGISRDGEPEWDSLRHIEVVFALESALGIRFDADELGELTDLDSIVEHAERHRAA